MLVDRIPDHEARFDATGLDGVGIRHRMTRKTVMVPGADTSLDYIDAGLASGDESYYYKECCEKDQIVLHFTVGYLGGDVAALTRHDFHVSVAFVIGRNGAIYELFPSQYWAYHLGREAVGGNEIRSRRTIAIEISNAGPLTLQGSELHTSCGDTYCALGRTEFYHQRPFRGYDYFASFADAQYRAVIELIRYLTANHGIPRRFLDENIRYEAGSHAPEFRGIVSHVNYRAHGKTDIGPAFDWDAVIRGVLA